jgi:hypothetical protein
MGLFDEIRRELQNALEEAKRAAEAQSQAGPAGPVAHGPGQRGPAPGPPQPGRTSHRPDQTARPSPATPPADTRLQRNPLERATAAPSAIAGADSSIAAREKLERRVSGEPAARRAPPVSSFDLGLTDTPGVPADQEPSGKSGGLTFTPREVLRALVLGEVLDEPKGRRARRPHPK